MAAQPSQKWLSIFYVYYIIIFCKLQRQKIHCVPKINIGQRIRSYVLLQLPFFVLWAKHAFKEAYVPYYFDH